MKRTYFIRLLLWLSISAGSTITAQAQERRMTMEDAVALALEKNRDLQVSRLETAKSSQKVREAWGAALPTVAASAQYLYNFHKQVSFLPGSFVGLGDEQLATFRVGGKNTLLGGISLYQPLLQSGVSAGLRAARVYESLTGEELADVRAMVVTAVKKAYLNVLITQEQRGLQEQSIVRNEQALKDARSLLAQGRASRVDTLRAFVTVENLRPTLIRLTNQVEIAKTELKRTIGIPEQETVRLSDSLRYQETALLRAGDDAFLEAVRSRPEVHRLELAEKLNQEQVFLQSAERLPKLAVIGLLQWQSQANDFRVSRYNWPLSSYLGLQLNIPVFSGYRTLARVQQAEISRQQSETQLANLKEVVRAQVKTGLASLNESRRRIEAQRQTVSVAELGYRITRDRWKQGIASRLDLSDAELSLTQAKSNYLQAVFDYLSASVEMDRILGRIQP